MFKRVFRFFNGIVNKRASTPSWVYRPLASPYGMFVVNSKANVNEDTAVSWSAIWRGIQLIGSAIGSMPFTIQEEDSNGDIITRRNHPLWNMINMEPHPFYSTFDFLSGIMFQVLLRGNAVIVINRIGRASGSNRPGSLRLIEWKDVNDISEDESGILFYNITGYPERIPHYDIIHIKGGVTKTGICGLDTLMWNKEAFGLALSSENSVSAYYAHGTHSEGFLSTDQQLKPDTRNQITEAWKARNRTGGTPFLTGGVKWNPMSVTPKDLQLLESRQFNVYEAARILGVSPHLLFAMDRANFSNVETLSLEFSKYTLAFWVEKIEQEFNRKIFRSSEKGRVKVNLNMDAFLRGDTEARTKYLEGLLDRGVLQIDEARKMEGYNAYPDGKGKVSMVPLNFQTLDQIHGTESDENGDEIEKAEEELNESEPQTNNEQTENFPPSGRAEKLNGQTTLN